VTMIEKMLSARKSSLQGQLATDNEQLDQAKASEEDLIKKVKELESALESQKSAVDVSRSSFEQASSIEKASTDALEEKRSAHRAADDKLMEAKDAKNGLEGAFENHGKAELGLSWKQLEPFVKQLEIEISLLSALPSTCGKPKEQRGSFDMLVLQELDRAFTSKIAELSAAVEKDSPAVAELEAALNAAEKECEASKERQTQVGEELSAARKEHSDCEEALRKATAEVDESKPRLQTLRAQLEVSKTALSAFQDGALTIFTIYKTKASEETKLSEAVEAEVAPPAEADA